MRLKLKRLLKDDTVLVAAALLAAASAFFVPPSAAYLSYIDFRVLALLWCLMIVVAGMRKAGAFEALCVRLLGLSENSRGISLIMILLAFFMSMLLTNDVTLITLVPFTMLLWEKGFRAFGRSPGRSLITLLVLETIAANLGSMLTPFGNPQNLYLYTAYGFSLEGFIRLMLPYSAFSLILLCALGLRMPKLPVRAELAEVKVDMKGLAFFSLLFILALLSVVRILDYRILLAVTALSALIRERELFKKADYSLLLTFVFFFIFVGNIGRIEAVRSALSSLISGHVTGAAVLASQFISNVPAALLLSDFTENGEALVAGVNIGGLGTLIASMASLISYKLYSARPYADRRRYFMVFTLLNIAFLAALLLLRAIIA